MSSKREACPRCGDATDDGYGLAFGGFGSYTYCLNQACGWFTKEYECPVCEAVNCNEHEEAVDSEPTTEKEES